MKKLKVTIKGSPNKIFSDGFEAKDFWEETRRYFNPTRVPFETPNTDLFKYYTGNKFWLVIDTRSMADHTLHGSRMEIKNV